MKKIRDRLLAKFHRREYREAYASSHLNAAIALQLKALRLQRGLTQEQVAELSGLKQSQISAMEQTDFNSWTLRTLRKLASAFELPLLVKLTTWGDLLEDACLMSPRDLERPSFEDDPAFSTSAPPCEVGPARVNARVLDFQSYLQERNASTTREPAEPESENGPMETELYG